MCVCLAVSSSIATAKKFELNMDIVVLLHPADDDEGTERKNPGSFDITMCTVYKLLYSFVHIHRIRFVRCQRSLLIFHNFVREGSEMAETKS